MITYLLLRNPFVSLFDAIQQFFYEFITLTVSVSVLILAIMDAIDSRGRDLRNSIGGFIIIINLCFNFGALGFMLVKGWFTVKEIYQDYKAKRQQKKNIKIKHKRPQTNNQTNIFQDSIPTLSKSNDTQNNVLIEDLDNLNESVAPFNVSKLMKRKKNYRKNINSRDQEKPSIFTENNLNATTNNDLETFKVQDLELSSANLKDTS